MQTLAELRLLALKRANLSEEVLGERIKAREEARGAKNFARSDEIREELASVGIMLMDGGDGAMWRPGVVSDNT